MEENFFDRFRANLSQTDIDLFKKLGLTEFRQLAAGNSFVCGTHKSPLGSVHVMVDSMPAKFWTFTIHRSESPTVDVLETGSGDLYQYWPFVEAVLEGKFGMRTEPATPFIAGYRILDDEDHKETLLETDGFEGENVYICNITGMAISGDIHGVCHTVFGPDARLTGTFDECVQWLTLKTQEEQK